MRRAPYSVQVGINAFSFTTYECFMSSKLLQQSYICRASHGVFISVQKLLSALYEAAEKTSKARAGTCHRENKVWKQPAEHSVSCLMR